MRNIFLVILPLTAVYLVIYNSIDGSLGSQLTTTYSSFLYTSGPILNFKLFIGFIFLVAGIYTVYKIRSKQNISLTSSQNRIRTKVFLCVISMLFGFIMMIFGIYTTPWQQIIRIDRETRHFFIENQFLSGKSQIDSYEFEQIDRIERIFYEGVANDDPAFGISSLYLKSGEGIELSGNRRLTSAIAQFTGIKYVYETRKE